MSTIAITKRTNGGLSLSVNGEVAHPVSGMSYVATKSKVKILLPDEVSSVEDIEFLPSEFTIDGVTGFTTVSSVCDALDAIGAGSQQTSEIISDSLTEVKTAVKEVAGQSFLMITDTNAHGTLDCTSIYVVADAVFSDITVGGSNVVAARGLTAITVPAGTLLPFGKAHATSITLTSGKVLAYVN